MISVIIPVYNLENYIERTLISVCNQTYRNIEIIVVDDGSTDNSFEIISKLSEQDKRIIPISQKNGGVTKARLHGVSVAKGEWIGFVDGDDEIEPDMFEILLNNAVKYNADISHCGYKMIFDDGRENEFYGTGKIIEQDNIKGQIDILEGTIVEPGLWNKLFKKSLFDKMLQDVEIDYSIKNNEDLLINYYLFNLSQMSVFEDVCKYSYIVRQGSASRTVSNNSIYDPIKVKEIIFEKSDKNMKSAAGKALLSTCINTYCGLSDSKNSRKKDLKIVRSKIIANKEFCKFISKKQRLLYFIIMRVPFLFGFIYKIYSRYFQVKKYS